MKEDFENYTDPILEECYRIKEEFNAQFFGRTLRTSEKSSRRVQTTRHESCFVLCATIGTEEKVVLN